MEENGTMTITNPTRFYTRGVTRNSIIVPKTSSHLYTSKQQQDWALRAYAETERYISAGGRVVFITPTYSDLYLPKIVHLKDMPNVSVKCFNRQHVRRFLNSLRKYWERRGVTGARVKKVREKILVSEEPYTDKLGRNRIRKIYEERVSSIVENPDQLPIRYIWCCEYGSDNVYIDDNGHVRQATERPHYHCLLYLPPELVNICRRNHWTESDYMRHLQSFWHYGEMRRNPDKSIFVSSEFAVKYVTKYCCKDIDFYENDIIKKYLYDSDGKLIKAHKEEIQDCIPGHWQSMSFGSNLLDVYDTDEKCLEGVDFKFLGDLKKGKSKKALPPTYILRKRYMYHDDSGNYFYKPEGITYMGKKFFDRYRKRSAFYDDVINNTTGRYKDCLIQLDDERCSKLRDYITGILGYIPPTLTRELALYELVYEKLSYSPDCADLDSYDLSELYDDAYSRYMRRCLTRDSVPKCDYFCSEGYFKSLPNDEKYRIKYDTIEKYCDRFAYFSKILYYCRELHYRKSKESYDYYMATYRSKKKRNNYKSA